MEKNNIKISVLMAVFSEPENWFRESIDSVLNQTFIDFEFIIINDNPQSDLNKQILEEYKIKDSRIVIIENDINIGLTKSLNIGIKSATGKYIVRQDADDISYEHRFEEQYKFMELNPDCVVSGSYMLNFNDIDKASRVVSFPLNDIDIRNSLFILNPISHPTVIIRSSVLKDNNILYNENIRFAQDHKLWCDLSDLGSLKNLDKVLVKHRVSDRQISTSKIKEQTEFSREIRKRYFTKVLNSESINFKKDISRRAILKTDENKNYRGNFLTAYYLYKNKFTYADLFFIFFSGDIFKIRKNIFLILRERLGITFFRNMYIWLFTKKS